MTTEIQSFETTISTSPDETKQTTKTNFKVIITRSIVVIFIVVAVIGVWQIYDHVARNNESEISLLSKADLEYIEHFRGSSLSKAMLYKNSKKWSSQLRQMKNDIKHFMDQKMAVRLSLRNLRCFGYNGWYQYVSNLQHPKIELNRTTNSIKLHIESLCPEFRNVCKATNGTLTHIEIVTDPCYGSVEFSSLPASLEVFQIVYTLRVSGTVDLTSLPQTLQKLSLNFNQFSGTVDLPSLPRSLRSLELHKNQLTGIVDLTRLPANLTNIRLDGNSFEHYVGLEKARKTRNITI